MFWFTFVPVQYARQKLPGQLNFTVHTIILGGGCKSHFIFVTNFLHLVFIYSKIFLSNIYETQLNIEQNFEFNSMFLCLAHSFVTLAVSKRRLSLASFTLLSTSASFSLFLSLRSVASSCMFLCLSIETKDRPFLGFDGSYVIKNKKKT